jgi:SAM-dependent methyltransferase
MAVKTFGPVEVARMARAYATPEIVEQRAITRRAVAAQPGERGLDIGCGLGFLACELAHEIGPTGRMTGIDVSPDMLAGAREHAARERVLDRLDFEVGRATALEFPAAAFDFVTAVQVYLYVPDIGRALAEAARVLRPGGRLVVVDTDWDSCVWLTNDRERHRRILDASLSRFAHPHLPPRLPGLLAKAGFRVASVGAVPLIELRYDPNSFSASVIESIAAAVGRGTGHDDLDGWARDLRGRTGEGDYFFSVNRFLFVAAKPF